MIEKKLKLNKSQKEAVEFENGELLVVAGAGAGKTNVITQRIKHLIEERNVNPNDILALTFTEKAAQEMLNRVDDVMPLGYTEPWVNTFHSFADKILREEGLEIGLDPGYKILSSSEQWLLFRQHLFEFELNYFRPLGNPTKFISAILKLISRAQDEAISADDMLKFSSGVKGNEEEIKRWAELSGVYKKYEEIKIKHSYFDFGDLINWTIRLFNTRSNILEKYQEQFKHILVDEFQDTNYAQYEMVKILFPNQIKNNLQKNRSLLVVGDDSQSIYKFRGAAVSNILEFMKDFPNAKMIKLLQNYRSSQAILDPAYKLIQNNNPDTLESKLGISKKLVSEVDKDGIKPQIFETENLEDEAEFVVRKILEILAEEPSYTYKDFAILARANAHLDPFVMVLRKYGMPYQLVGNRGLYDREEIRDILAMLRVLINPLDSVNLYRVLNIKTLNIPHEVITEMLSQAKYKRVDLWEVLKNHKEESVVIFYERVKNLSESLSKFSPSQFVFFLVNSIEFIKQFIEEETVENQLCIKNLNLFLEISKKFEISYRQENKKIPNVIDFLEHIDLLIEAGDNPAQAEIEDIETINLLTVHASKGLEFSVVFIVNMISGRFPTRNRSELIELPQELIKEYLPSGDAHIQEERRLFYVGMTRAKKYLFMTYAKNYGGSRDSVISGYLKETNLKVEEVPKETLERKNDQVGLFGLESGFRDPAVQKIGEYIPKSFSYSQVSTYQTCALQYKYGYVLRIPSPPNHNLSFGISIHNTLHDFYANLMFGEVSLEKLLEMYEKNWNPLGYVDEEHRRLRFESGKELLKKFWKDNKKLKNKPVALEKSFKLKIDGVPFIGKIDRIDPLIGGGVEIIDYKTGNSKDQKEVDKDDQVSFYAVAAKEALGLNPKKLTLYFVETGEKISTTRTDKQLEEKKLEAKEVMQNIRDGKFQPNPGMHCKWCDYKDICPYAWKG